MEKKKPENNDIDVLLSNAFKPAQPDAELTLSDLFIKRLQDLKIKPTDVLKVINIERRTLKGILSGKQKMVDFTNLIKIADFLQISKERVVKLYIDMLERNYSTSITSPEKVDFIKTNFDLSVLKKAGFIDSLTDFDAIEQKIVKFLGLKTIFDYTKPPIHAAFSAGLIKPKNDLTRSLWIQSAYIYFEAINNPYEYERQALIEYFPKIRWHSTNVEFGLLTIIKDLFKLGVTVIYQEALPSLHLRGATFAVNDKPCIALTNYVGYYPTLWFALIHELFHVLFDWDEINTNSYHLSDDENGELIVKEKEIEADEFAREYLFSKEKSDVVKPHIKDSYFIDEYARTNHVHPSFIYVFNAYDSKSNREAWARAMKNMPDINICLKHLNNPWNNSNPISQVAKTQKFEIFN